MNPTSFVLFTRKSPLVIGTVLVCVYLGEGGQSEELFQCDTYFLCSDED